MSLSFQYSWFVVLLFAAVSFAAAFFFYRYTLPPVSRGKRYLLTALRFLSLFFLFLAVCEPLLTVISLLDVRPKTILLVDRSISMTMTDASGNREKKLRALLDSSPLRAKIGSGEMEIFSFAQSIVPVGTDSLHLDGPVTDIAAALASIQKEKGKELGAVILVSDGNNNNGNNPLNIADRYPVPVFSVGIGDSSEQRDVAVASVVSNSIAYVKSEAPVDVTIRTSGYKRTPVSVSLFDGNKLLENKTVFIGDSARAVAADHPVRFSFTAAEEGVHRLSVRINPLPGEVTEKNNTGSFVVKILKNKIRIAVIAGAPSPDVSALMQAIRADQNLEADLFVQSVNGSFIGRPMTGDALGNAECFILSGFPTKETATGTMTTIVSLLQSRSTPLFFSGSRTMDYGKLKIFEPFLPVAIVPEREDEQSIFPGIVPAYRTHLLVIQEQDDIWEKLPPIFAPSFVYRAKPEALTLATWKIQNVLLKNPLLAARSVAGMKSFAVAGYGISRWKLLAAAGSEEYRFFDAWISSVLRWLTTKDGDQRVQVRTTREFFSRGEPVDFTGEVYDEVLSPVDAAALQVVIRKLSSDERSETELKGIGNGLYQGSAGSFEEGEYLYNAVAVRGSDTLGTSFGKFSVGEQSVEFADVKMNIQLLRQIAVLSGGKFIHPADAGEMIESVFTLPSMSREKRTTTAEYELWNLPVLLSLIVLLLSFEWFVRKRSGML